MDLLSSTLVNLLAATDAIWLPLREAAPPLPGIWCTARARFAADGAPFVIGGGAAARQAGARALGEAIASGLAHGQVGARSARLTDAGEAMARAMAGLPPLASAVPWMRWLAAWARETASPGATGDLAGWAWEAVMARPDAPASADRDALMDLEDALLPALARGWLESRATALRHVGYRITGRGLAALAAGDADRLPVAPPGVAALDEAVELYFGELSSCIQRMRTRPTPGGEIGPPCLPVGCSIFNPTPPRPALDAAICAARPVPAAPAKPAKPARPAEPAKPAATRRRGKGTAQ